MPAPSEVDWIHALALYNQGLKIPKIAEIVGAKPGTVSQHAKRHKWVQRRTQAQQAVSEVIHNIVLREPKTVQKRAEDWIERTVNDVERTVSVLEKLPVPESLDGIRRHEEVWGLHVKRGRSTFGLDNQSSQVNISIGMFGKEAVEPSPSQVIDVDTVPQIPDTPTGTT